MAYVYSMHRVSKLIPPKRQIIKDISLSFLPGAKIGILGINGAGKSTVLRIMAGVDTEYDGEAKAAPNLQIGYLEQEPKLDPEKTVRETVEESLGELIAARKRLNDIYAAYGDENADFDALAKEQERIEAILFAAGDDLDQQLEIAADALRLPPWDAKIGPLSGGEKRRVALCRLLLSKPDMLLLDEPTNHLDAESVDWLENYLVRFTGTVVAVTHDRYFLDNAAEWILELDRGHGIPWKGNYSTWLEQKTQRLAQEEKEESARQKALKRELEWSRKGTKGQQVKSKSRMARFEELSSFEYQQRNETQEMFIPVAERLGDQVIDFENVSKAYGDRLLMENVNFQIPAGAIVGIIGPNGAGKSTLFRMISGKEQPDSGKITIGKTVKLAVVDQSREELGGDNTVFNEVSGGLDIMMVGKFEMPARAHLAKTLVTGANVLLLDEPSNDLDVETLRALEDALGEFAGTVLCISHDRWFLNRIATHIIAFEGDSRVFFYEGNYAEYEENKIQRLGAEAARPHRIRYRPLTIK